MSATETIEGMLKADGTVELNQKSVLQPGRVRVTMERVEPSEKADVWAVLDAIREERMRLGMDSRTRAEIDAQIQALRNEWDDASTV